MLDMLAFYIPEDRRQVIARGGVLAKHMRGAALSADISGFTPLTEALVHYHGAQRGAEELTYHLERIYNVLVEQLHLYQGSVIGYSGDAFTGWFNDDDGQRALAAAFGIQKVMKDVAVIPFGSGEAVSLAVKVAVVVGETHRLLVGDPAIQLIDLLGGSIVERLAAAAEIVRPGEIVVDTATAVHLKGALNVGEQRQTPDHFEAFVVVTEFLETVAAMPWPEIPPGILTEDQLRPWVLPAVYERMRHASGHYLTELRSTVALFLHFEGIDYELDPAAEEKLDAYIRWVQAVLTHYGGVLLQVTLGEKGNYLYGAFGAPIAHEDNARRAVSASFDLQSPPEAMSFIQPVSIGLSGGTMRTGPTGSSVRRFYGVLGDEVNVAARLMVAAKPGEIIATERVLQRLAGLFESVTLPPLHVKGKAKPIPVYHVMSVIHHGQRASTQNRQLVGREKERIQLNDTVRTLSNGQSGVVLVEGEAGIGKSSLINEWLEALDPGEVTTLLGTSNSIEQAIPYHAWGPIFRHLFQWESLPAEKERRRTYVMEKLQPLGLVDRAPLLNAVLPIDLPDNELTKDMTGRVRADNTHEVLVALLQQEADAQRMLIVFEDVHWLDSASWALALAIVRQVKPILLALVTRPIPNPVPPEYQTLLNLPGVLRLQLEPLPSNNAIQIACHCLGVSSLPEEVKTLILEKAEGHPFFCEELAYALRDSGILRIVEGQAVIAPGVNLTALSLPNNVEGVVTHRIDMLLPGEQLTVKIASVIGRVFTFQVLDEVHPVDGDRPNLFDYLQHLQSLDVTPLDSPLPNLSYRFKHIITQEAAYNLLLFAQRRQLHQAVAEWYERVYANDLSSFYPLLAHHWLSAIVADPGERANLKAIEYLEKSGVAALHNYANREAADYFSKLLGMVTLENAGSFGISEFQLARWEHQLGEAYNRLGYLVECEQHFSRSLTYLGFPLPVTPTRTAWAIFSSIARQVRIRYQRPGRIRRPALMGQALEARRLACVIYERLGLLNFVKNNPGLVGYYCPLASLDLAEEIGPSPELAIAYSYMAGAFGLVPVHKLAQVYERLSLQTAEQVNNPLIMARVLMATSVYSAGVGRFEETEDRLQRSIAVFEQGGVWEWWVVCMEMLSRVKYFQGQFKQSSEIANRLYFIAKQQGDIVKRSWALTSQMDADLFASNMDDILTHIDELDELLAKSHETGPRQKIHSVSALFHLHRGDWAAADDSARKLIDIISGDRPTSFGLMIVYVTAADTYLTLWERHALPDMEYLEQQAAIACKLMTRYAKILPLGEPASLRTQGLFAWLSGKPGAAYDLWKQGLARAQELRMPLEEALTNYELGRHLPVVDTMRFTNLKRAQNLLEELGVKYYDTQIQEALKGASVE